MVGNHVKFVEVDWLKWAVYDYFQYPIIWQSVDHLKHRALSTLWFSEFVDTELDQVVVEV